MSLLVLLLMAVSCKVKADITQVRIAETAAMQLYTILKSSIIGETDEYLIQETLSELANYVEEIVREGYTCRPMEIALAVRPLNTSYKAYSSIETDFNVIIHNDLTRKESTEANADMCLLVLNETAAGDRITVARIQYAAPKRGLKCLAGTILQLKLPLNCTGPSGYILNRRVKRELITAVVVIIGLLATAAVVGSAVALAAQTRMKEVIEFELSNLYDVLSALVEDTLGKSFFPWCNSKGLVCKPERLQSFSVIEEGFGELSDWIKKLFSLEWLYKIGIIILVILVAIPTLRCLISFSLKHSRIWKAKRTAYREAESSI